MRANFYITAGAFILAFVLLVSNSVIAQAPIQQNEAVQKVAYSDDGFPRLKWDVSTDLQFLFNDYAGQGNVLVRQNRMKRKKNWGLQYSAIRYRIQLGHYKTDSEDYDGDLNGDDLGGGSYTHLYSQYTNLQNTNIGGSVGYEWQKYYGRFMVHYGSDFRAGLNISENEYASYFGERTSDFYENIKLYKYSSISKNRTTSIALAPLFGMRYFIHPMISFTAETQLSMGYSITNSEVEKQQNNYSYYYWGHRIGNNKTTTTFINYTPVSLIGVTFHFEK